MAVGVYPKFLKCNDNTGAKYYKLIMIFIYASSPNRNLGLTISFQNGIAFLS